MKFRHEFKHEINAFEKQYLIARLSAVMKEDKHTKNGIYKIRSLYFDNLYDKALKEKINGVNSREKFRIRYYNGDTSFICLEKKSKINGLTSKEQAVISYEEADGIARGNINVIADSKNSLVRELYVKMKTQGLMPKTIVDYTRKPFIYDAGNVRVTLDYDIRTGLLCTDFLNTECVTVPVRDNPIILEVKWDEFLPSVIRDIVQIPSSRSSAFSKYAVCRMYE